MRVIDNSAVRASRWLAARAVAGPARRCSHRSGAARADGGGARLRGQPARRLGGGGARALHGRRDLRRPRAVSTAASTGDRRVSGVFERVRPWTAAEPRATSAPRRVRGDARPPPAHPGGQDGAGRPRPRRQRRRVAFADLGFDVDLGPLFSDARRSGAPGRRKRRPRGRRQHARGRPPDPRPGPD